jgi:hypothetical protein
MLTPIAVVQKVYLPHHSQTDKAVVWYSTTCVASARAPSEPPVKTVETPFGHAESGMEDTNLIPYLARVESHSTRHIDRVVCPAGDSQRFLPSHPSQRRSRLGRDHRDLP